MTRFVIFVVATLVWLLLNQVDAIANAWPDNTIGSGFGVQTKPERTGLDQLAKIKTAGLNYVRFDMWWDQVESKHGVYDWAEYDHFIHDIRTAYLKAVIILQGTNGVYSPKVRVSPDEAYGASWRYAAPSTGKAMKAFTDFAVAAVKRYGTKDIIWEVWNEPDMVAFWPPKPDPVAFSVLANKICRAIRSVAPNAKIIGPAIAQLPSETDFRNRRFLDVFFKSDIKDCLDAISIHPYRSDEAPETVIDDLATKVGPFIADNTPNGHKRLPVVVSEFGYSTTDVTPKQQAEFALRMHLADLLGGVPLTILYEWQDSADMSEDSETHFGMVDANGNNKVGATLITRILPLIEDAIIVRRLPTGEKDCFAILLKQPNGKHQVLAWMGLMSLGEKWTLSVVDGHEERRNSYVLSLAPQLIDVRSAEVIVAVSATDKADSIPLHTILSP